MQSPGCKRKGLAEEDPSAAAVSTPAPADNNNNVVSEGWAAVGGHAAVIQQLKEMVLLPLQYPEVFKHMGIRPPRGILFHGSPGTAEQRLAPLGCPVGSWVLRKANCAMCVSLQECCCVCVSSADATGVGWCQCQ